MFRTRNYRRSRWTEINPQDSNEQGESSHDVDSDPSFDSVPQDELGPWVDYLVRETHKADDLLPANEVTSKQAITIARHRWTELISNWNPAISTKQKKGFGSREDQPRYGKKIPLHICNQPDATEATTISRTTRLGPPRHKTA